MKVMTIIAVFNDRCQKRAQLMLLLLTMCLLIPKIVRTASAENQMEKYTNPRITTAKEENGTDEDFPFFQPTASNVTAFEGQTVYLPCRVHNLGDKLVSWMRIGDLRILTSGEFTYSSDERLKLQHLSGSEAWTLQLDRVKKSDAGRYGCQVNTEPKIMYEVQLTVRDPNRPDGYDEPHSQQTRISYESTAPVAAIMGPREQRILPGSTITFKCVITSPYQTRPIKGVQWFKDNKLLTFQTVRGGINIETVTGTAQTFTEATLANVTWQDTGTYSCRPSEGKSDSVRLRVENQHTEAMQHDATYISFSGAGVCHIVFLQPWFTAFFSIFIRPNIQTFSVFS